MVCAGFITDAGEPGEMELINIRKNITNRWPKIKNIVSFGREIDETGRIQRKNPLCKKAHRRQKGSNPG
jgi:hypothetical protein